MSFKGAENGQASFLDPEFSRAGLEAFWKWLPVYAWDKGLTVDLTRQTMISDEGTEMWKLLKLRYKNRKHKVVVAHNGKLAVFLAKLPENEEEPPRMTRFKKAVCLLPHLMFEVPRSTTTKTTRPKTSCVFHIRKKLGS